MPIPPAWPAGTNAIRRALPRRPRRCTRARWRPCNQRSNVTRQTHFAGKFVVTAFLLLLFSNWNKVPATLPQQRLADQPVPVDYLQVTELPLSITLPTVEKTEKGYLLKCSASNASSEQLLGVTFLMLVLDSENKVRGRGSWSSGVRVPAYATTRLSIRVPLSLSIKTRYRVV